MTTLAATALRDFQLGDLGEYPVIASDIIYQGAAVGLVDATGHARPLVAGDRFVGFATGPADNSAGSAAAINVQVRCRGSIQLSVTGALITDIDQPVYATDDNAFGFTPVGGTFIGFVSRYVSSGVVMVDYAPEMLDPWAGYSVREALAGTKTFDAQDCGKLFCCTEAADGDALTLPPVAAGFAGVTILYVGAFGGAAITIAPDATGGQEDMILGPDIAGEDVKTLVLTKATARRGDYVKLGNSDLDGYHVTEMRGIWVKGA
jgi:hypothetical protein